MQYWIKFPIGLFVLAVGVGILSVPKSDAPSPAIATAFASYLIFCAVCCFVPPIVSLGGGRVVAGGASVLSLYLSGFFLLKMHADHNWGGIEVVYVTLVIGLGTGVYVFTRRLPRWLGPALHAKPRDVHEPDQNPHSHSDTPVKFD